MAFPFDKDIFVYLGRPNEEEKYTYLLVNVFLIN